jgi:plastocyanin/mono/diheme cytochrome c family protein
VGAVRKLATVVIVGLVALSTLLVVYLAAEPARRDDETTEQQATSIERGTSLYITYCLQCHGPAGLGVAEEVEPRRTGGILNQDALMPEEAQTELNANFQSDDPVQQGIAEDWIRYRILYGIPSDQMKQNFNAPVLMPAFANDLNVEQINDLVYLIMHGDWNYVYNTAVHDTGITLAQQECLAAEDADAAACEAIDEAPPAYPTVPAPAEAPDDAAEAEDQAGTPEAQPEQDPEADASAGGDASSEDAEGDAAAPSGEGGSVEIEALDSLAFSESAITVKPGDTIILTNAGFLQHDLAVDDWGGPLTPMLNNGETAEFTIPEDAEPGEYEFYCSVPGHKEGGMVGTFTVEAP